MALLGWQIMGSAVSLQSSIPPTKPTHWLHDALLFNRSCSAKCHTLPEPYKCPLCCNYCMYRREQPAGTGPTNNQLTLNTRARQLRAQYDERTAQCPSPHEEAKPPKSRGARRRTKHGALMALLGRQDRPTTSADSLCTVQPPDPQTTLPKTGSNITGMHNYSGTDTNSESTDSTDPPSRHSEPVGNLASHPCCDATPSCRTLRRADVLLTPAAIRCS